MFKLRSCAMAAILCLQPACNESQDRDSLPSPAKRVVVTNTKLEAPAQLVTRHEVEKGSSMYQTLKSEGILPQTILDLVKTAKPIMPLQDVASATTFEITWDGPERNTPLKLDLRYAADSSLVLERKGPGLEWMATRIEHPITVVQKTFHGFVSNSLWESAEFVGMDPSLITSLAEVFAWQIDFSREVKRGDRWRLTVEQKIVDDKTIGWGNILVAEYENDGQLFTGIRYPAAGDKAAYYFPNGQSLKRMFIKSPIKFGRITSGFSRSRFHPVLHVHRPHNGVDYGAPTGTPVMAVGGGTIESIGRNGGSGNMVKIRHNGTYSTAYLHLKGFATGLRRGSSVEQGQVIGYVGATGLA
ncbi:MAG: M23 family metallopeptidase, partial [Pseudobdellovibrionaceae bacterium]|nr:M23 family metallopeptidase [Pseudobdellovibrionaceae bacterium]